MVPRVPQIMGMKAGTRSPTSFFARTQILPKLGRVGVTPYGPTNTGPSGPTSANRSR